jgi:hypothetical protein
VSKVNKRITLEWPIAKKSTGENSFRLGSRESMLVEKLMSFGFDKKRGMFDQLNNYKPFKNDPAPNIM